MGSAKYFKVVLRSNYLTSEFKFFLLKKWRNCNKGNLDDLLSLVCNLPFKDKYFGDAKIYFIKKEISEWGINEEGIDRVEAAIELARKEARERREEFEEAFYQRMGFRPPARIR